MSKQQISWHNLETKNNTKQLETISIELIKKKKKIVSFLKNITLYIINDNESKIKKTYNTKFQTLVS